MKRILLALSLCLFLLQRRLLARRGFVTISGKGDSMDISKSKMKSCARTFVRRGPELSAVTFNYGATDR